MATDGASSVMVAPEMAAAAAFSFSLDSRPPRYQWLSHR